jgi:hypothetical protein
MAPERLEVLRPVAPGEDAGVHPRVKRLDAAIHHLRETCQLADWMRIDAGVLDRLQGAARREELVTEAVQPAGERDEARLLANRQ